MLTRRRLLALAGSLPILAAARCRAETGSTLERARRAGVLRVGIADERPYGYIEMNGRVTGAQPEVARAALAALGIGGLAAVQTAFDGLIPGLRDGRYDMITAGMAVTPSRCRNVAFSRPDFVVPPAFLVPRGNPRRITTFGAVARSGIRLGVLAGSIEREYALAAGVPGDRLSEFRGPSDLFRGVANRSVAVGALTALSLVEELRRNPGYGLEVTDPFMPILDGRPVVPVGAFVVRADETELLTAFDGALAALQESGDWLAITSPFGFTEANLPPQGLTTAAICTPVQEPGPPR